jgi:UDP-N-acetylmuramate dehydrogenase
MRDNFIKEASVFGLKTDLPMSSFTTFKTGGNADFALFPKSREELKRAITLIEEEGLPYYVVGKGSNLLVCDEGFRGVMLFTTAMTEVKISDKKVYADAGVSLTALARQAGKMGLSGMECLCGIPGTVGGAVYMNAGAYGGEMKDITVSSDYFDGEFHTLFGEEQGFSYRKSAYTDSGKIIVGATLNLLKDDPEKIKEREEDFLSRRREKQPLEYPSAGSTFKRYPGRFTGQMIEEAGLKGFRVGGAAVSEKHAGFIVNDKNATAKDIITLIGLVRERVFEKFGVRIECEVKYLSEKGEEKI